ncbi:MAG: hypothetical protein OXI60_03730 [Acidiferrobacterales bacterium]|nr:hypothetical protein [Acidiferrobacterales bacterium]
MIASVNIVTAMKSEALPLIDHFCLERMTQKGEPFSIFGNDELKLIVSGVGTSMAHKAVRYLSRNDKSAQTSAWLNVGVVGHGTYATGTGFLANCIVESATQRTIYPSFTIDHDLPTGKVITVDGVNTDYQPHAGYDMEAFGFATAATQFSTLEMIHCFKVVSDNQDHSVQHLTKTDIQDFIAGHVGAIDRLCGQLHGLAKSVARRLHPEDLTIEFAKRWRMTTAQREILKRKLHKTKLLELDIKVDSDIVRDCLNASAMLACVQEFLDQHWKYV